MKDLINAKLERIRKSQKLTRKGLEKISGFKERTIGAYERGENYPSNEYIEFMCLFFGYIEDYFKKDRNAELDPVVNIILMYQSIFNYDDKKMAELLNISLDEFKNKFNINLSEIDTRYIEYEPKERFIIAENLGIKPSLLHGRLDEDKNKIIYKLNLPIYDDNKKKIDESIRDIVEREIKAETKGINLTREYYASIIKQRNQPEIITPDTQKEAIPDKYKEILELLPYASDSFTQNLKNKLLELKKAQQIEDL